MKSLEILSWFIDALGGFSDGRILVEKKELETIKQDLEVLEILRKHLKNQELHFMEDTPKIQQWLEENENDR